MKAIHHALAFFLFALLSTITISSTTTSSTNSETAISFVKSTCNSTAYPSLCNKICLPYAQKIKGNIRRMAIYALKETLGASKTASKTVTKLSKDKKLNLTESIAIKDCIEESKDTLEEIKESLSLIGDMKNGSEYGDMKSKIYDIKTWISAALTDEDTCMDGLDEENVSPKVKAKIGNCIRYVSMLCSNALTIIGLMQY